VCAGTSPVQMHVRPLDEPFSRYWVFLALDPCGQRREISGRKSLYPAFRVRFANRALGPSGPVSALLGGEDSPATLLCASVPLGTAVHTRRTLSSSEFRAIVVD